MLIVNLALNTTINVSIVMLTLVMFVNQIDSSQLVNVNQVIPKLMESVSDVTINVLLAPVNKIIVNNVLVKESIPHTVTAQKVNMMLMVKKIQCVTFVMSNVLLVPVNLTIVILVPTTELMLLTVCVKTEWLNKETFVLNVTTHVKSVPKPQKTVPYVFQEENSPQIVDVH
jgi:hypothetical protein